MKSNLFTLCTVLGLALPLANPATSATQIDTNGDGVLTLDEVQAIYPDITEDLFTAMDLNADGTLDDDETIAAQEAGLLPAS